MKSLNQFVQSWGRVPGKHTLRLTLIPILLMAFCVSVADTAQAQAVPSADRGGLRWWAGGTASGYIVGYGQEKLLGATAFFDADTLRHFGIEGEARWLVFHQTNEEHAATYAIGPRYYREFGRFHPYVKGLVGLGEFNFPYSYGHGSYLVVAPGGGLDFRITHRVQFRAVDFEYQVWPQFTYGSMSSYGVSTGIRVRIF